jgi:hypothetical protein
MQLASFELHLLCLWHHAHLLCLMDDLAFSVSIQILTSKLSTWNRSNCELEGRVVHASPPVPPAAYWITPPPLPVLDLAIAFGTSTLGAWDGRWPEYRTIKFANIIHILENIQVMFWISHIHLYVNYICKFNPSVNNMMGWCSQRTIHTCDSY